jgi:CBS domain-containing protein
MSDSLRPADDLAALLPTCRPFDSLSPDDLATAVAAGHVQDFASGQLVVDAFAEPPADIFVVVSGEAVVWVDPDRISEAPSEAIGPGEAFGFSAALTERAVGPRVVARTAARVARFPLDVVMPAFASRSGARFLAEHITHARRLAAGPPMYTVVADLVRQEPLVVDADDSVIDLARQMTDRDLPYAAVDTGDGQFGLITDEGLRRRVLAEGLPVESPARAVMTHPAATISLGTSTADALIEMLDHDVQILLVTNADGTLKGAVGERDFVLSPTTAGVGIIEQIRRARSIDDLVTRARGVPAMLGEILARGLTADRVIAVNSAIVDSIVRRAIALVFDGLPDLTTDAFTWLSLGSNGRREAVLSSDVDAAVTFEDDYADDIPRYREAFGAVAEVLTRCGISVDTHRAFPMHQGFSRTDSEWRAEATGWLARPRENQGMIMASLLVDARPIFGDLSLPEPARVFADFNRHPATMELLLYDSLARRARLRTMRDKLAGRGDDFNVKERGLVPIVNIARWAALGVGSAELQTTRRLRAAAGSRLLPERDAERLIEAFDVLQLLRLEHQLRQVEAGVAPDDVLERDELSPLDRTVVEGTVREIATIQRRMDRAAHMLPADLLAKQQQQKAPAPTPAPDGSPPAESNSTSGSRATHGAARAVKKLAKNAGIRK